MRGIVHGVPEVRYLPQAQTELDELPENEQVAIRHAVEKLQSLGQALPYPYSSNIQQARPPLRELRPQRGRSPWRALYRQFGDIFVIAAICPEAQKNPRGFKKGVRSAQDRLAELEE